MAGIKVGKSAPKAVPAAPEHTPFVLGTRPAVLRAPSLTRITPKTGQTQYGKIEPGNTGMSGQS